ncbi:MAG: MoaD/ThiS family protein [Candidatus Omnitrophica bacterium]|nr:MoaD/ThiS family protein [Candidatus Omnitrophota bacterium]
MEMRVSLFAALKDMAGKSEIQVTWRKGITCSDVLAELKKSFHSITPLLERSFVAVNGNYAELDWALRPEDEVAVLPPVSGG